MTEGRQQHERPGDRRCDQFGRGDLLGADQLRLPRRGLHGEKHATVTLELMPDEHRRLIDQG